ncbi:MAG: hypothetical protein RLZZ626_1181 [Actinomycetota bacterium]|jgi:prolipoprotein diacylglyceryl transferase
MRLPASIPAPTISSFQIGNVTVHFYALIILLGITIALIIGGSRLKARGAEAGVVLDVALWAVPFGIVGGRLFHVFTHFGDYFGAGKDPKAILYIWEGGLAIYGALIFGIVGAVVGARFAGLRLGAFVDAIAPGLLLAQAIGRWGNYFNQELFGKPTDIQWLGLEIPAANTAFPVGLPAGTLFHPTFLYEMLWDLLGVFLLLWLERKLNLRWGRLFALYLVYYSVGRFFIESIRIDVSDIFLGLRTNQWSAVVGVILGIVVYIRQTSRTAGNEPDVYLPGRAPAAKAEKAEAVEADDEIYETADSAGDAVDSDKS